MNTLNGMPAQPNQQWPQNPPASQQVQDRIIWVRSYAEVEGYPMVPNSKMQFWDINEPVIYWKSTDMYGNTYSIDVYDIVKRQYGPRMPSQSQPQQMPQNPAPYQTANDVTVQMNALTARIDKLTESMVNITNRLNGIAGEPSGKGGKQK